MYRSDRIYLSKFELDPDPEYQDLDEFDLEYEICSDEFYENIIPEKKSKQPEMDDDMY